MHVLVHIPHINRIFRQGRGTKTFLSSKDFFAKLSSYYFLSQFSSHCHRSKRSTARITTGGLPTTTHSSTFLGSGLLSLTFYACLSSRRKRMPPKKKEEEKKILLGRPGNNLKSGIVSRIRLSRCVVVGTELSTIGWACKCWKIYFIPSHHEVLAG